MGWIYLLGIYWAPPSAPMTVVPLASVILNSGVGGNKPEVNAPIDLKIVLPSPAASARTRSWSRFATGKLIFAMADGEDAEIYVSRRKLPSWNSSTCYMWVSS